MADEPEVEESGAEEDEDEPDLQTNSKGVDSDYEEHDDADKVHCHLTQNTYVNYITIALCHSPSLSPLIVLHGPYG